MFGRPRQIVRRCGESRPRTPAVTAWDLAAWPSTLPLAESSFAGAANRGIWSVALAVVVGHIVSCIVPLAEFEDLAECAVTILLCSRILLDGTPPVSGGTGLIADVRNDVATTIPRSPSPRSWHRARPEPPLAPGLSSAHEAPMTLRFTILGCGSSGGVPRLGGHWGDCDPADPRNRRQRCSMLVERTGESGITRVLIDTSPDMRAQLLAANVGALDGVVFTHAHADHCHGIDDLRMVVFNQRRRLDVWADETTWADLDARFRYAFETPPGSSYPPILTRHPIDGPVTVGGAGGPVTLHPVPVVHGDIMALGLRIGTLCYMPDIGAIPDTSLPLLEGLDIWVLDALRRTPHPSHLSLPETLDWFARMTPARGVLTNMHIDLDWATVDAETAANVTPAHDGMVLELPDPPNPA